MGSLRIADQDILLPGASGFVSLEELGQPLSAFVLRADVEDNLRLPYRDGGVVDAVDAVVDVDCTRPAGEVTAYNRADLADVVELIAGSPDRNELDIAAVRRCRGLRNFGKSCHAGGDGEKCAGNASGHGQGSPTTQEPSHIVCGRSIANPRLSPTLAAPSLLLEVLAYHLGVDVGAGRDGPPPRQSSSSHEAEAW